MLSEDFDKKIRDAADLHHPAYREEAWKNMNRLLDKHLPEKEKDRKRFLLFFLLLAGLAAGSVWLLLPGARKNYQMASEAPSTVQGQASRPSVQEYQSTPGMVRSEKEPDQSASNKNNNPTRKPVVVVDHQRQPLLKTSRSLSGTDKQKGALKVRKARSTKDQQRSSVLNNPAASQPEILPSVAAGSKGRDAGVNSSEKEEPAPDSKSLDVKKEDEPEKLVNDPEAQTADSATKKEEEPTPPARKGKPSFMSKFSLLLSAGPDISYASGKAGKLETVKGIGLAYQISDRLTVRTGFYTARKIYTAAPEDYKFSGNIGNYYPNLKWVDGDCIVYEIPLLINYRLGKGEKSSWFVSGGLSSLLMHTEEYNYYYKPWATGNMMHKKWAVSDKNKHYFSLLAISGGYSRKINDHLSILAEPYLRMPLKGVGEGKIDLKGAGVLFTVGIKPWK